MKAEFDGAIILEVTNQKNDSNQDYASDRIADKIIRPLAPFALHELFVERDIPSTVINYVDFWEPESLADALLKWCNKNNIKKPFILGSTLFNQNILNQDKPFAKTINILKQHLDCKLILGGPTNDYLYESGMLRPDIIFSGRALHLFKGWIDGEHDLNCIDHYGLDMVKLPDNTIVESPIVAELYDDYCLTSTDVLNFETRLGCKFNCTFCSFEFRNAKKVKDSSCEALYGFFKKAKEEYGITNFNCVDDTFNEDDEKIDNLYNAVSKLDYQPKISGFTRFDLLMAKQHQVEKLDKIGFHGHFFGIESLHPVANKKIRKGTDKEKAFDFLRMLTKEYPHWHKCFAYIVGLPEEPYEHVMEVMKTITTEKIVESIHPSPLILETRENNNANQSLMVQDPEKYGLEITGELPKTQQFHGGMDWKHKLGDLPSARQMTQRVVQYGRARGIGTKDVWEWVAEQALKSNEPEAVESHISNYINKKVEYLVTV